MRLRSSGGFSMIEMLVTTAILTSAMYLVIGTMNDLMQGLKRTDNTMAMQSLRETFGNMVLDRVAWNNTITFNKGFACWNDTAGCAKAGPIPFSPYMSDGQLFQNYDPANNPNHGFQLDGVFCSTFSTSKPDTKCPVRINFVASPKCAPTSCVRPEFEVQMSFQFAFPKQNKDLGIKIASGALTKMLRTPSTAMPVQLTSTTTDTLCPNTTLANPVNLMIGFDPKTGALTCDNGTKRIFQ